MPLVNQPRGGWLPIMDQLPDAGCRSKTNPVRSGLLIKNLLAKLAKRAGYTVVRNETFNRLSVQEPIPQRQQPLSQQPPSQRPTSQQPLFSPVSASPHAPRDMPAPFAIVMEESFSADHFFQAGEDARGAGDDAGAFAYFCRA